MKILIIFMLAWAATYMINFALVLGKGKKIRKSMETIEEYLSSASMNGPGYYLYEGIKKGEDFDKKQAEVFLLIPSINRTLGIYCFCKMSHHNDDIENLRAAEETYLDLRGALDYAVDNFMQSLNPLTSLKILFSVPSRLIQWIGFSPKPMFGKIFNLLCWALAFLLGMYQNEIKLLINSFFK